jgi:hypothetical protein
MQELQEKKNQARIQEHKNLGWRVTSCLASQDSVYMDLVRQSRSAFSDKNLVQKEWKKNLDCKPSETRTWKERCQDRRLVIILLDIHILLPVCMNIVYQECLM